MGNLRTAVIKAGISYVEEFEKDNAIFMEHLVKFKSVRRVMVWVYYELLADKKLIPIENLDIKDKHSLWETAHDYAKGRLTKEEKIEITKSLYVLKTL